MSIFAAPSQTTRIPIGTDDTPSAEAVTVAVPVSPAVSRPVGPTETIELNQDGARGELIRAQAHLAVDLFGFVSLDGSLDFSFTFHPGFDCAVCY